MSVLPAKLASDPSHDGIQILQTPGLARGRQPIKAERESDTTQSAAFEWTRRPGAYQEEPLLGPRHGDIHQTDVLFPLAARLVFDDLFSRSER